MSPLCNQVNCKHDNEECQAWMLGVDGEYRLKQILYDQGSLYLAYSGDARFMVAKAKRDGSDVKKVYESEEGVYLNGIAMCDGELILYYMPAAKDENGNITGSSTVNLMSAYDMETGKEKVFVNEERKENLMCYAIGVSQKDLYYIVTDLSGESDQTRVFLYKGKSGESQEVELKQKIQGGLLFEDKDYRWDAGRQMVVSYDLKTGETEDVLEVSGKDVQVSALPGGILQMSDMLDLGDGTGVMAYQYYDLREETLLFEDFQTETVVSGSDGEHYFGVDSQGEFVGAAVGESKWEKLEER